MSRMTDFTVPSTVPGRTLHAFCCEPEGEVRAVLQLSHGMVEFIDRYKPLAEYLAGQGIVVVGHDHLGHGGSIRTKADYGYFAEPDGNRAVLDDLHAMTLRTKERYPGVPYFLLGHSMGSFYARQYPGRQAPFARAGWALSGAFDPRFATFSARARPGRSALRRGCAGRPRRAAARPGRRIPPRRAWRARSPLATCWRNS